MAANETQVAKPRTTSPTGSKMVRLMHSGGTAVSVPEEKVAGLLAGGLFSEPGKAAESSTEKQAAESPTDEPKRGPGRPRKSETTE